MLLSGQLPASLQPLIAKLIQSIVRMLKKLHDQVNKRLTTQSAKNQGVAESDDNDSSYEDTESSNNGEDVDSGDEEIKDDTESKEVEKVAKTAKEEEEAADNSD